MQPTAPFVHGSATSKNAAIKITPKQPSIAFRVFEAISAAAINGLTSKEAEAQLRGLHQTISARFNELNAAGCIRLNGMVRNGSEVYITSGVAFHHYQAWLKAKTKKQKNPAPPSQNSGLTLYEMTVLSRARAYAKACRSNTSVDATREGLLEAARWVDLAVRALYEPFKIWPKNCGRGVSGTSIGHAPFVL